MPHTLSHQAKSALFAGVCALALTALSTSALAHGGGAIGGHMGGMGTMHTGVTAAPPIAPNVPQAPPSGRTQVGDDETTSAGSGDVDVSSHARFQRTNPPTATDDTTVTTSPSAPRLDPPPPAQPPVQSTTTVSPNAPTIDPPRN